MRPLHRGPARHVRPTHARAARSLWLCAAAVLLASVLPGPWPAGQGTAAAQVRRNTFLCYDVKASKGATKFQAVPGVHIVDLYEDLFFTVSELRELCNPASREESVPTTPTHLNVYQITAAKKAKRSMPKSVVVDNEFGTITLDAILGDKFFVPTAKSLVGTPSPLGPPDVDHFKCYDVKVHKGTPKVPNGIQITLTDQFTGAPKVFKVIALEHLCPVARKNDEPVLDPCGALLCYQVEAASHQPEFEKVKNIFTDDQFGMLKLDAIEEDDVCVPSTIRMGESVACLETPTTTTTTTTTTTSTAPTCANGGIPCGSACGGACGGTCLGSCDSAVHCGSLEPVCAPLETGFGPCNDDSACPAGSVCAAVAGMNCARTEGNPCEPVCPE